MVKEFSRIAILAAAAASLIGCASLTVKKPDIGAVKRIAIVSVTSNYHIHDIKDKEQAQSDADLAKLGKSLADAVIKGGNNDSIKAQVQIVTHGAAGLSDMVSKLGGWTLVSVADVVGNPAYQDKFVPKPQGEGKAAQVITGLLQAAAFSDWVVPEGMATIPLETVSSSRGGTSVSYVNGKKEASPEEQVRAALGQLCADLGVDAVVVAQVKLSYKREFITITGFGPRSNRKAVVETDIAVVDAKGKLVMATKPGWRQFEGGSVPLITRSGVDLADDKGACVKGYDETIDASIKALSENIAKALN